MPARARGTSINRAPGPATRARLLRRLAPMAEPDRNLPPRARQVPLQRQVQPRDSTTRTGCGTSPKPRTVSIGSSPAPCPRRPSPRHGDARCPCTQCRARGPVIQRLSPGRRGDPPVQRRGQFQAQNGPPRPRATRTPRDRAAPRPPDARFHLDPRRAQRRDPRARRSRVGVFRRHHHARDARRTSASLQGGVWPVWLQGSSVT
jgi:hypothetical protein